MSSQDSTQRWLFRLREQARDIYRLASGLNEAQLSQRLEAGQWSLKELVCHLARVQQIFVARIEAMLTQDNPEIAVYEPDSDEVFERLVQRPLVETMTGLITERQRLLKRLESLEPADWERPGQHPEFPFFNVRFQVEYMVHHEAHHIYQMYQRRAWLAAPPR